MELGRDLDAVVFGAQKKRNQDHQQGFCLLGPRGSSEWGARAFHIDHIPIYIYRNSKNQQASSRCEGQCNMPPARTLAARHGMPLGCGSCGRCVVRLRGLLELGRELEALLLGPQKMKRNEHHHQQSFCQCLPGHPERSEVAGVLGPGPSMMVRSLGAVDMWTDPVMK